MPLRNTPIRRKLAVIILTTTGTALLFMCASFFAYEYLTFRRSTIGNLATLGEVIAANSTAALAFDNAEDATQILSALSAERHIVAAALYTTTGELFARYPETLPPAELPRSPADAASQVLTGSVASIHPVVAKGKNLGTLYLQSDMGALEERVRLYGSIAVLVVVSSLLVAFLLSQQLQQQITRPLLGLADTVRLVSEKKDFTVRSVKHGNDEIGVLTDAFNDMLAQLQMRERVARESEARLRAVLNSAVIAVIVVDDRGRIVDWNACAEKMFGRARGEAMGMDLGAMLAPLDPAAGASGMRRFTHRVDAAALQWPIETTGQRRDGTGFPVEVAISPIITGGVITFCAFVSDLTERKRAEAELQAFNQQLEKRVEQRTQQLESANKELEAFSYSVSHDLRAPLRHIDGYTAMLAAHVGPGLDEKGRRYLTVISEAARRMGRLIDDLLSFSRHGRAELRFGPVNLRGLVEEVKRQLHNETAGRTIDWRIDDLPEVCGDVAMLHQVFMNLIGNAVKYSRNREQAVIEIGAAATDGEITVHVRDNGAGFNPKYKDRLFGVFQRLHSESEFEGTGVGLANVQRIVHRHGGRVWAEGEVNVGATFYFTLPTRPGKADPAAAI
ncbi:MAG TPA: ATP-binding protein [Opitutus sp.]|nr:ATP-binding protein [Opitutus sp.]